MLADVELDIVRLDLDIQIAFVELFDGINELIPDASIGDAVGEARDHIETGVRTHD